jgi:hypothetical protein
MEVLTALRHVEAIPGYAAFGSPAVERSSSHLYLFGGGTVRPTPDTLYKKKIAELRRRFVYGGDSELKVMFVQL